MTNFLLIIVAIATVVGAVLIVCKQQHFFKTSYFAGLGIWAATLPVIATVTLHAIVFGNLFNRFNSSTTLNIEYLGFHELVILAMSGFFLLSRLGNILALTLFCGLVSHLLILEKLEELTLGMSLILSSLAIVAILNDSLPWCNDSKNNSRATRIRSMFSAMVGFFGTHCFLTIGHSGTNAYSALNDFKIFEVSQWVICLFVSILVITWILLSLQILRWYFAIILTLPTLFLVSIITTWSAPVFIVPVVIVLSLAIPSFERRRFHSEDNNSDNSRPVNF